MKLRENIYTVGVTDAEIRSFHGYETPIGTTYNAFLVVDEKITLIDTVKGAFAEELLANIKAVIGDRAIDYIICNHVEPDHSGALPLVVGAYPSAVVYGTANCEKELKAYYPELAFDFVQVKNQDNLNIGEKTFTFIPMPMVHWPDSMSTYLDTDKILFSNDAFGQHIGTGEVMDCELESQWLLDRAGDYYANIILPFATPVKRLMAGIGELAVDMICPSHGVILAESIPQVLEAYARWCENVTDEKKVVIVYDTMWGTTQKLALQLGDEYSQKGYDVECINLSEKHHSYAMAQILEAKYVFVGSPTLNNQMMPSVAAFLCYLRGLKPKDRIGRAFGSYGWSGESIGAVQAGLEACGFEMLEPVKAQWNI
ncbi:MAG: FprA family A-type flavoprotein [Propionibacteriaceae bacterium]|nr:FprA family A-type flavoprotein [Propionibacteriaceae bacterium]